MAKRNPLDAFALNIGRLCNEWQDVEFAIEMMFARVAGIQRGPATAMLHCIDARQLIGGIKVGLAATRRPQTNAWAEEVMSAVDYIDNVLRPRRNRYVHDAMWETEVYGVLRQQREPKLKRPQARMPTFAWRQTRIEDISDLRATLKSTQEASEWLFSLDEWRQRLDDYPEAVPIPLQGLRPQLLPPDPTGKPLPEGTEFLVL